MKPEKYAERVVGAVLAPLSKMIVAQQQKIILQQRRIDALTETAKSTEKRYGTFFLSCLMQCLNPLRKRAKAVLKALAGDIQAEKKAANGKTDAALAEHEANVRALSEKMVLLQPRMTKAKAVETVDNWLTSGDPADEKSCLNCAPPRCRTRPKRAQKCRDFSSNQRPKIAQQRH